MSERRKARAAGAGRARGAERASVAVDVRAPAGLAPRRGPRLTAPVEDYLKAIYSIELSGGSAGTNDIAQRLEIAPASVSGMVRRLAGQGLLTHEPYRGARLTPAGRRAALRTIRRHRVIEAYLVHALGYSWDGVHDEAERLEHAASDALIDRMARTIGEPVTDPHGAPIPTREGAVDETRHLTLADVAVGARARLVRVSDEDAELLRYLSSLGLRPDITVAVRERAPYDGPITLDVSGKRVRVGAGLANHLQVKLLAR